MSYGDEKKGYPTMTLGEMCQDLNDRYKTKKMPAERHIQQLIDKVSTREEAELAAGAIARFHAERVSLQASSGAKLRRRGMLDGRSLLMFIAACQRSGNVDAAVDAAEKHLVMGLTVTRRGLEALLDACVTVRQIMRAYALWRKVDIPVDARCATAVVRAAARVGDADAAAAFAAQFADAGTPPAPTARVAVAAAALDRADVALATEAIASARAAVETLKANGGGDGGDETDVHFHVHVHSVGAEAMAALCAAQANAFAGRADDAAKEFAAAAAAAAAAGGAAEEVAAALRERFEEWPGRLYGGEGEGAAAAAVEATPARTLAARLEAAAAGCGLAFDVARAFDGIDLGGEEVEEGAAEEVAGDEGAEEGAEEEKS